MKNANVTTKKNASKKSKKQLEAPKGWDKVETATPQETAIVVAQTTVEQPAEQPIVKGSEAWALGEAKKLFGETACVWAVTHDLKTGKEFKAPRYRVGFKAETETGAYIENGKRMKGIGASWTAAVEGARQVVIANKEELAKNDGKSSKAYLAYLQPAAKEGEQVA